MILLKNRQFASNKAFTPSKLPFHEPVILTKCRKDTLRVKIEDVYQRASPIFSHSHSIVLSMGHVILRD